MIEYIKRFSMANCITTTFPDTYQAHCMTVDLFNKRAKAGERLNVAEIDLWPNDSKHAYDIPKKVGTVLFSPFVESFYPNYLFCDGCRYIIGTKPAALALRNKCKETPRIGPLLYNFYLEEYNYKIDSIWQNSKKIIILYDSTRAGIETRERVRKYDKLAVEALEPLGWKVIRTNDNVKTQQRWMHYEHEVREKIFEQIKEIEEQK